MLLLAIAYLVGIAAIAGLFDRLIYRQADQILGAASSSTPRKDT